MAFKKEDENIVRLNDINDLKLHKIKPADLQKMYVDKTGQEFKLKYDPIKKKVVIIKIIKSVLDGKYIKNKFDDNIAPDKKIETEFKYKMGALSSQFLKEKYHLGGPFEDPGHEHKPEIEQHQEKKPPAPAVPGPTPPGQGTLANLEDTFKMMDVIKGRMEAAVKNMYDSNVLNERYSYDDKIFLDDLSSLIKQSIIEEMNNARIKYEDLNRGYEDAALSAKLYSDQVKARIAQLPPDDKIKYLRQLRGVELFIRSFEMIIKTYSDLDYKISTVSEEKINARTYAERQKFTDAKTSINTCVNDTKTILSFLKSFLNQIMQ